VSFRSLPAFFLMLALCACANPASTAVPDAGVDAHSHEHDLGVVDTGSFSGPELLSETGLYSDFATRTIDADVLTYGVRFPLWADGATKTRHLWLPPGTTIDTSDPDAWVFPVGTRVWKEFRVDGVLVETRFMQKLGQAQWERVAYAWRDDGSDADAARDGATDALGTAHDIPSVSDCNNCHRGSADNLLGVSAIQLATGETSEPLAALANTGRLSVPLAEHPSVPGTPLEQAVLGYLHGNCGHCHSEYHPLANLRTIRFRLPLGVIDAADAPALTTLVGSPMHHTIDETTLGIVPGDPESSQMWRRMQHRGDGNEMPPLGTETVDTDAVALVRAWIAELPPSM
jgi:hypothetical protein